MLAVIKTGGKQYIVTPGQKIKIEKLEKKEGEEVIFDQVLLLEKNPSTLRRGSGQASSGQVNIEIGIPLVEGAKVVGKVLSHGKAKKLIAFKFKAKTRRKVKKGHRQPYTEVEIEKIELSSAL